MEGGSAEPRFLGLGRLEIERIRPVSLRPPTSSDLEKRLMMRADPPACGWNVARESWAWESGTYTGWGARYIMATAAARLILLLGGHMLKRNENLIKVASGLVAENVGGFSQNDIRPAFSSCVLESPLSFSHHP